MLASSLLWTLDKPHGDLLTKPWKKKNFCDPYLVSPMGRVSEFRRDLRASQPGTWADVLCPEILPRRGGFRLHRPCCLLPEPGSVRFSEARGAERRGGVMRDQVCRGETTMVSPCLPPPWWGSRTQRSTPSPATDPLLLHGGLSALVSWAGAVKGRRKLRRRAQQVPGGRGCCNSVSASAHCGPCSPSPVRGRARG